jgi:hypothetical protein
MAQLSDSDYGKECPLIVIMIVLAIHWSSLEKKKSMTG